MTTDKNQWELYDRLRLTRDCELGREGEVMFVLAVDGPYMDVRVGAEARRERTGRDYAYATKVGEGIPPGAYRLDRDVQNPMADRRYARDWRKEPYWAKGTPFVVRERRRMGDRHLAEVTAGLEPGLVAKLRAEDVYTVVEKAGQRHGGLYQVGPGDQEQYAALVAALVGCEESLAQFMTRIDCNVGFAEWLVEHNHVQRSDLERWWHIYQYGEGDAEPPAIVTLQVHDEVVAEVSAVLAENLQAARDRRMEEIRRELSPMPTISVEGGVGAEWGQRADDTTLTGRED